MIKLYPLVSRFSLRHAQWVLGVLSVLPCLAMAQSTVVVLDASNSMWAQQQGRSKISQVREQLVALKGDSFNQNTGLVVYGHRSKACTDIETVFTPTSGTASQVFERIQNVQPFGRSPLSASLQQAAELLPEGGNILLISDGNESCDADPCAVAKKLAEQQKNLHIHVLGFEAQANATLKCLVESTAGTYAPIAQSDTWFAALNETPSSPSLSIETASTGELLLTAGDDDVNTSLVADFVIYTAAGDYIDTATAQSSVKENLPTGRYKVSAAWGPFKQTQMLNVVGGQTVKHHFNLGSLGKLALTALDVSNKPVEANFTFYALDGTYITNRLLKSTIEEPLLQGKYRVKVDAHNQMQEAVLEVNPNKTTTHTFKVKP